MSYPEQRKREKKMARLNQKGVAGAIASLKIYLDARCASNEVRDAYNILVKASLAGGERVLYDEVMRCEGDCQDPSGEYNTTFSKGADYFHTEELHHTFKKGDTVRVLVVGREER